MGDACGGPPPRVPPTHFSTIANSARDLIYRGFVGGQMLSVPCSGPCGTKLTSSATIAHALSIGSMSATLIGGQRKHDLTFSTLNNQISGTTTFVNAWCPGMTVAVSTSIKEGASDGAINVVVTEGAIQQPPCCATHSSRASTPTSLALSTRRRKWAPTSVTYESGNSRHSELGGHMCGTPRRW